MLHKRDVDFFKDLPVHNCSPLAAFNLLVTCTKTWVLRRFTFSVSLLQSVGIKGHDTSVARLQLLTEHAEKVIPCKKLYLMLGTKRPEPDSVCYLYCITFQKV